MIYIGVTTDRVHTQAAFKAYSEVRKPRCESVWAASCHAGSTYDHHGPHGPTSEGLSEDLKDLWTPIWRYNVDDDIELAVALLQTYQE